MIAIIGIIAIGVILFVAAIDGEKSLLTMVFVRCAIKNYDILILIHRVDVDILAPMNITQFG